jgi:hypothetical protein
MLLTKKQREEIKDKLYNKWGNRSWSDLIYKKSDVFGEAITETERKVLAEVRNKLDNKIDKERKKSRREISEDMREYYKTRLYILKEFRWRLK